MIFIRECVFCANKHLTHLQHDIPFYLWIMSMYLCSFSKNGVFLWGLNSNSFMALWWSLQNPSTLAPVYFLKIEIPQRTDCFQALLLQTKCFCRAVPTPQLSFPQHGRCLQGACQGTSETFTNFITHLSPNKSIQYSPSSRDK